MKLFDFYVRDIYGNDYRFGDGDKCILSIDYCTSYFQFTVQDIREEDGVRKSRVKDLFYYFENVNLIDSLLTDDSNRCWINS